mgnify:FL=1
MIRIAAIACLLAAAAASQAAQPPTDLDYAIVRSIPVQDLGRWPPMDTLARQTVETITGRRSFHDRDPMTWLLAWTFDPQRWAAEPLIPIANAEVRRELELPAEREVFSYDELLAHQPLMAIIDSSRNLRGRKASPLETVVRRIGERLAALQQVFTGQTIRLIPDPDDPIAPWRPIAPDQSPKSVIEAWSNLKTAFLTNDTEGFASASTELDEALAALPAAHRPSPHRIATELTYNRVQPFRLAWIIMAAGTAISALTLAIRRPWAIWPAAIPLIAGFVLITAGLWLRGQIAGRLPAANMYESLLFVGWGTGLLAIVSMIVVRHRAVPLTASAVGAAALMLADLTGMDAGIRPIAPVLLDTIWMSIHVPVIMVSYSVLALAVLLAHVQVVAMALVPSRRDFTARMDDLHYWYVLAGSLLLFVGIITGSMWAASSWGRYWGWDPKEVWSLIAFLGYVTILHIRIEGARSRPWLPIALGVLAAAVIALTLAPFGRLTAWMIPAALAMAAAVGLFMLPRGPLSTAIKSIGAFWLVIMTYVGVNYVLGSGLHSYGFGTGAVVRWLFLAAAIDATLVIGAVLVCTVRRGSPQP